MSGSSAHKHRYKNVSVDADELRRRREEEGIQLRKQKREEQLSKRRNVNIQSVSDDEMQVSIMIFKKPEVSPNVSTTRFELTASMHLYLTIISLFFICSLRGRFLDLAVHDGCISRGPILASDVRACGYFADNSHRA